MDAAELIASVVVLGLLLGIPLVITGVSFLKGFPILGAVGAVFCLLMTVLLLALFSPEIGDFAIGVWTLIGVLCLLLGWAPVLGAARMARPGSWWFRNRYVLDKQHVAAVKYLKPGEAIPAGLASDEGSLNSVATVYPEKSRAVSSLTLGVMGVVGLFILSPFAWALGAREVKAIDQGRRSPRNRTVGKTGMILGIVGTAFWVLVALISAASIWVASQESVSHAESLLAQAHAASDPDEALAAVDELIETYGGSADPELQVQVAKAMTGRGIILGNLGRFEEARNAHEEMVTRHQDSSGQVVVGQVAVSMAGIGRALEHIGRYEEALAAYEAVITRYETETDPVVVGEVAHAMVGRALALENLGDAERALVAYENMIERFGDSQDPGVQVNTAVAMTGRGIALVILGRNQEAIAAWDDMISRFETVDIDPPGGQHIDYQMATAYLWKLKTLAGSGDAEGARSTWASMVTRFSFNEIPEVDELLSEATNIVKELPAG